MEHNEGKWHDVLQQLRVQLRRAMDGETASQQRGMGLAYGINFGVNMLRLKEFANALPHEEELADLMWQKEVREMKLLSLYIRQPEQLSLERALILAQEVETLELAEQLVFILLRKTPIKMQLLRALFSKALPSDTPSGTTPYLLLNHLSREEQLTTALFSTLKPKIITDFCDPGFYLPSIIYNALLRLNDDAPHLSIQLEELCLEAIDLSGGRHTLANELLDMLEEEMV